MRDRGLECYSAGACKGTTARLNHGIPVSGWVHLEIFLNFRSTRLFFQIRSHSQILGTKTWAYLLGGHHSTHHTCLERSKYSCAKYWDEVWNMEASQGSDWPGVGDQGNFSEVIVVKTWRMAKGGGGGKITPGLRRTSWAQVSRRCEGCGNLEESGGGWNRESRASRF